MNRALAFLALSTLSLACSSNPSGSSGESGTGGSTPMGGAGGAPGTGGGSALALDAPDNATELLPWLEAGNYSSFVSEAEYHVSSGPHGDAVKVFYSPRAWEAIDNGEDIVKPGGAVIKELTTGSSLYGWAVYVRGNEKEGAESYYFYELIKPSQVYGDAYGSSECTGCHTNSSLLLSDPTLVVTP